MAELKRDLIKYVRDRAKSQYEKGSSCEICAATENLEFHHFNSMTQMLDKWMRENRVTIETSEEIFRVRDIFISEHYSQIYIETVTLCKFCHAKLHNIYGLKPGLATAKKQARWVQRQREKNGLV